MRKTTGRRRGERDGRAGGRLLCGVCMTPGGGGGKQGRETGGTPKNCVCVQLLLGWLRTGRAHDVLGALRNPRRQQAHLIVAEC